MATTPITPPTKNNNFNLVKGEGTGLTKGKSPATTAATASAVSNAKVKLTDVLRSDVLRVEVVDTDFVITVKPGRKILIREGALKSTIDENFSLEFADQQVLTGTELFSQAQTSVLPSDSNWKDLITEPTVTPKNVIETPPNISAPFAGVNLTTLALGVGGLALAGGGGGGGGSSSASSSSSGTPSATPSATNAEQALQLIQNFAQLNTSQAPASPTGVPPTDTTFNTAGVQGVTLTNVAAINDALATSAVDRTSVSTAAKSQVLVDTYNAIFALADGTADNATVSQTLNTAQLALIGADLTALQNGVNPLNRLALLNSILDGQTFSGVDRISKINTLIGIANAIQDQAAGLTTHLTTTLTSADFAAIGVVGVTANNLSALLARITTNAAAGSDALSELQSALYDSLSLSFTAISTDTGFSSTDFVTNDNTLTLSGTSTAADGSALRITLTPVSGSAITFDTTVNAGVWQVASTPVLADNTYSVVAALLNAALSPVRSSASVTLVVDTSDANLADGSVDNNLAGQTIAITGMLPDTGVLGDFKTGANQFTFSGTTSAADGTQIVVKINDSTSATYYATALNGQWALDQSVAPLATGQYKVEAILVDAAGNASSSSAEQLIDVVSSLPLVLTSKTVGAMAVSANLTLIFSDDVTAQAGKNIVIVDESTNSTFESIAVNDSSRVTINGNTVTINPSNNLVLGKNYHATLDGDAFAAPNGTTSSGITDSNTWTFRPVDPATTVIFSGSGVDVSNGINADELPNLTLSGTMSSANLGAVSQEAITSITFTNTDDNTSFEIGSIDATLLPTIDAVTHAWTLVNDVRWTSQLVSGKHYAISVELSSQVSGTATQSTFDSAIVLVDVDAPTLTAVTCNKTSLKIGEAATYTLTFSEDPGNSLTMSDFTSVDGSIQSLLGSGLTRTVIFTPTNHTVTAGTAGIQLNVGSFTDRAGNVGGTANGVTFPTLNIDTEPPGITAVAITGLDSTGANKTNPLAVDDQIKITLSMSEPTVVNLTGLDNNSLPKFRINVGGQIRDAHYASGSGTSELVFKYTVTSSDQDSSAGITANANALSLSTARITDVLGNDALLNTDAVAENANSVRVDGAGGNALAALARIQTFAENNNDPLQLTGTAPVAQDYLDAGVTGYASNVAAINDALATPHIKGSNVSTRTGLQSLVTAYGKILALADTLENTNNVDNPDFTQYALIGVQNVNSIGASLLGDVIDLQARTSVETVAQIQNLANAVMAVLDQAKGSVGLTQIQLEALVGVWNGAADALPAVLQAIANTANDGAAVDTLVELHNVVNTAADNAIQALGVLQNFADQNSVSKPTPVGGFVYQGSAPSVLTYTNAGITGVTATHLDAINDALATSVVTSNRVPTIASLQNLVNAYKAIATLADGFPNTLALAQPDADAYDWIGVTGLEPSNSDRIHTASLLSDVIDRKGSGDIDTVLEIQALADAVTAVMDVAAGGTNLTLSQLSALGFNAVPADKLDRIKTALQQTADDGSDVNTYANLSALITAELDAVQQALQRISSFALNNQQPYPSNVIGAAPTEIDYQTAGVTGVDSNNLTAVNDALATSVITDTSVDTVGEVQALVNAYNTIYNAADGQATAGITPTTAAQYTLLGLTGMDSAMAASANKAILVGDVIDRLTFVNVNTITEVQALIDAATAVLNASKNVAGLTKAHLESLGIANVTDDNLSLVVQAINNTADDGSGVDTVSLLQGVVNAVTTKVTTALSVTQTYANDSTATAPTAQHYLDLGATGITASHATSINTALATSGVSSSQVNTIAKVQGVVKAYQDVFSAANGLADTASANKLAASTYSLLGITGLDTGVKVSLMGDVLDLSQTAAVNTAAKLQALADAVSKVFAAAAGGTTLTATDLSLLGISNANAENMNKVLQAIQNTADNGTEVDTFSELQSVVNKAASDLATALQTIQDYAQDNTLPEPTVSTYLTAGVQGVTNAKINAINDALATSAVDRNSVNTVVKVQDLVNTYNTIFALADGTADNATVSQTLNTAQLALIGADLTALQNGVNPLNRLALLNSILDGQSFSGVDRISKINTLIGIANAIQDQAAGLSATLTSADFAAIGVVGVTANNLPALLARITTNAAAGSDALPELQSALYDSLSLSFTAISTDTGFSSSDFVTNDNTLTLSGTSTAADGSTVKITLTPTTGTPITLTTTLNAGVWVVAYPNTLADGVYTVGTQLLNATNSAVRSATPVTLTVDTSGVYLPSGLSDSSLAGKVIAITGLSPDTGLTGDFKTSANQLTFSGTTTAADGTHVVVKINDTAYHTTVTNGTWSLDNSSQSLPAGSHTVQAFLEDAAGNLAASAVARTVVIDASSLALQSKTTGAVATTSDLTLIFSDNITAATGKYIQIVDESTNAQESILVTNTARVTISGNTVTINPSNDLVVGKTYHATIDVGAFVSTAGTEYAGLPGINDWSFRPVDPVTTVTLEGLGVDASNGINATELSQLQISGVITTSNINVVSNLAIAKITFASTDGLSRFDLTTALPTITNNSWTLANDTSWTSQLLSGKTYTVSAQLTADITDSSNNVTSTSSVSNSLAAWVDKAAPALVITCDTTTLKLGQTANLTFTFDEVPMGFSASDVTVTSSGGTAVGSVGQFMVTTNPKVYTAVFTPTSDLSITNTTLVSVANGSFTDAAGNLGTVNAVLPSVSYIDTRAPAVSSGVISGVDSSNTNKTTELLVSDKIQVTLTMSEATTVNTTSGTPTFAIDVGGVTQLATYVSGSGTSNLVFRYVVALGDGDVSGGITALANALALNGGTLRDSKGNDATLATAAVTASTNTISVETNAAALTTLGDAANANTASAIVTPASVYARAGVVGVDSNNLDAINSALNSLSVDRTKVATTAQVQALVNAYVALLALADNGVQAGTSATTNQFDLVGVTGISSATSNATSIPADYKARLLSDVIDRLPASAVGTVSGIQGYANKVEVVMQAVNGQSGLTALQLQDMGITGVTDLNLSSVLAAIASTPDDGSSVNTLAKLQAVANQGISASTFSGIQTISTFAGDNTTSKPLSGAFSYVGTAPTMTDYTTTGITGVDANNVNAINDALATLGVTRLLADTPAKVQAVVDAYRAVLALADGIANAGTSVTAQQFTAIGVSVSNAATNTYSLALLNNTLDSFGNSAVDTAQELNYVASVVNAIQDSVNNNVSASSALVVSDFTGIGLTGVTAGNLAGIRASIAAQTNGASIDTRAELQDLIDFYNVTALSVALTTDTGNSTSDKVTSNNALTVGAPIAGATRYYSVDGGAFSTTYTAPTTQGQHTVAVRQVSSLGYFGQTSSLTLSYDSTAPDTPNLLLNTPYYNYSRATDNNPTYILSVAFKPVETDIASIQLAFSGLDNSNDVLYLTSSVFDSFQLDSIDKSLALDTQIRVFYTGVNKTVTFKRIDGLAFTIDQVQAIEANLRFKTAVNATQGNRTFTFTHTDIAGNISTGRSMTMTVDTIAPSPVDLTSSVATVDTTFSSNYSYANAVAGTFQSFATAGNVTANTDVASIRIKLAVGTIGQTADVQNDQLSFSTFLSAITVGNRDYNADNISVGTVTGVNCNYTSTDRTLTFTLNNSGIFSSANLKSILGTVGFSTATTATQGSRIFYVTTTDLAGNVSPVSVRTFNIDTEVKSLNLGATVSTYNNSNLNLSKAIAPNLAVTTETDIKKIMLNVGGLVDPNNDKLVLGNLTQTLSGTNNSGSVTVGGVAYNWSYVLSTTHNFSFTKTDNTEFLTTEISAIETGLSLQTASTNAGLRTFSFSHQDTIGNTSATSTLNMTVDTVLPAVTLNGVNANYNTTTTTITSASTAISLDNDASAASVSEATSISKVQVRVRGLRDGSNEKLTSGITSLDASGTTSTSGTGVTVGASSWNWSYSSNTSVFTFTLSTGTATALQAAALIQSLGYKNTSSTITDDVRQFFISVIDLAGNANAEATTSIAVSKISPTLSTTNPVNVIDTNNDQVKGDQFVVSFSEPVRTFTNFVGWTIANGSLGAGATITPLDQITVNNISYASNFLVTTGTGASLWLGQSNALTLSNANTLSTNTMAAYVALPSLTFGGDFTIETWIFLPTAPVEFSRILDLGGGAGSNNIWLGFVNDNGITKFEVEFYSGSTNKGRLYSSQAVTLSAWTHIAVTLDLSSTVTMYVNGVSSNSSSAILTTAELLGGPRTSNYLGKSNWSGDPYANLSIANLLIYDDARSVSEIKDDMNGAKPLDTDQLVASFALNGNLTNGVSGGAAATAVNSSTANGSVSYSSSGTGSTISVASSSVIDAGSSAANANLSMQVKKSTLTSGSSSNNILAGTSGNDFIAGQGGDDNLTGGAGADTFAWLLGETGSDTVTDFKVADGDMLNLSGLLTGKGLSANSTLDTLATYLQLSQSGNDAILKIVLNGSGIFTTPSKTITFTSGWVNGLNDTVLNLIKNKVIWVDSQTSTPLVLDLNGDGVHTVTQSNGVAFDLQGNGQLIKTAWTDGHDGLLALDLNHDGAINSGAELFGDGTLLNTGRIAQNGFEALQQYDLNLDGVIDAQDSVFSDLKVWVDTDGNGASSTLELHSLLELGVQSLDLNAVASNTVDNGNVLSWLSSWMGSDGQSHTLADVSFTTQNLSTLENMVLQAATQIDLTQPSLDTYMVNTADVLATSNKTLVITGDASDHVSLDAGWHNTGNTATLNGYAYAMWESSSAYVMVDQKIQLHMVL